MLLVAQLPEVKNFIYGDFESKYDRTVFKKIPGKAPEVIFYTQSGKELERLNIEKFDRYDAFVFAFCEAQARVRQGSARDGP